MPAMFVSERSVSRCAAISAAVEADERPAAAAIAILPLQTRQQRGGVPAAAAHRLHVLVELVDQRRGRQRRAVAVGFGEADAEVLAHPVDGEAEIVAALVHGLVAVLHLPRAGRALGDHLDHLLDVEAGLLAEMDAFREPLHEAGDAYL